MLLRIVVIIILCFASNNLLAETSQKSYNPSKVVYDVSDPAPDALKNIMDRIGFLQKLYNNDSFEASIIVVVHEGAIPLFKKSMSSELMSRARSLAMGEIIKFRICEASARMQKISADQLHDFVTMVPMADAEIVELQQAGYAYLR